MSLRRRLSVSVGVLLAAVVAAAALWPSDPYAHVPTLRLEPTPFFHRVTAEGNLKAVESTPLTAPIGSGEPQKIAWLVEDGTRVATGDVVVRFDPTDFEKKLADGSSDRRVADFRLSRAEVEQEAEQKKLERDAEVSRYELENAEEFQTTDELIYSKMEIIESQIDTELARERTEHAERSQEIKGALSQADIDLISIERRKAEITIEQARQNLDSLEVVAPHAGIVVLDRDWRGNTPKVGETVWPGREVATIPDLEAMEAEVYVLEADAGGLAPGQKATVVLESHPGVSFEAEVKSVDPIAQRRLRWVPVQYFRAVLSLERTDPRLMKPGGRVRGEIVVAALDEALAVPRQAVVSENGTNVVYRRGKDGFEAVQVALGASALGRVVVTEGLAAGDEIALCDPKRGQSNGNGSSSRGAPVPGGAS